MSGPPLSGKSPAQAAGSSVTGSSLPQALIQRRQRLTYELRLSTLVILPRPAPQPAAGDSAVAQPTTTPFTGLVRAPEPIGDMPPRHIPRPTSLRALHCVPSGVVVCAWLPEPCPAATGGSGFTIETGSESAIGININFVDVLLRMGKLAKEDYEAWRLGTIPYLERAIRLNLSQLKDMLRTLKDNARKGGLRPSGTVYVSWGKSPRRPLRFSRSGNPGIEQAHATHFVTPRENGG